MTLLITDCVFCQILAGDLPGSFVYRDEVAAVFMDIQPVNPGHLLVLPVRHAAYLADMDGETAAHMMAVAHRMAAALRAGALKCEGVNFFLADGEAAMQEIFHVHLHVFPRFVGDGFGLRFAPEYYGRRPSRDDLERTAATLRQIIVGNETKPPAI
jgi:histidine triad (HIT) family protein